MYTKQRLADFGNVFMKTFLIILLICMIEAVSASDTSFQLSSSFTSSELKGSLRGSSSAECDIDYSWIVNLSHADLSAKISLVSPFLLLGDLSRDIRMKVMNGSYLKSRGLQAPTEKLRITEGDWRDISAALPFGRSSYLLLHSFREEREHEVSFSFLSPSLGLSLRRTLVSERKEGFITDYTRLSGVFSIDGYLLAGYRGDTLSVDSYLGLRDGDVAARSVVKYFPNELQELLFESSVFPRKRYRWTAGEESVTSREKSRRSITYTISRGRFTSILSWSRHIFSSLPFALYRGEVRQIIDWNLSVEPFSISYRRETSLEEKGERVFEDKWSLRISGEKGDVSWKTTCTLSHSTGGYSSLFKLILTARGVKTGVQVVWKESVQVSLDCTIALKGEMWNGKMKLNDEGFKELSVTIDR